MKSRLLSLIIYLVASMAGAACFLYPFFTPPAPDGARASQQAAIHTPLFFTLVLCLCLIVLLYEIQGRSMDARLIALLGMLIAINAVLRFIEVSIPGPGGFSPIFLLIILTGYVFGGRFGFLMGALTMLVSALITGGVGPWLPGQMFAAGWVGSSATLCRGIARRFNLEGKPWEHLILMAFGAAWGLLYGAILNLWFWPFVAGPTSQSWSPGITFGDTLRHYGLFYLVTSLAWDLCCSLGNVVLIAVLGSPTLRILRRFEQRFFFDYLPLPAGE